MNISRCLGDMFPWVPNLSGEISDVIETARDREPEEVTECNNFLTA